MRAPGKDDGEPVVAGGEAPAIFETENIRRPLDGRRRYPVVLT
jgi:hypothetical protein